MTDGPITHVIVIVDKSGSMSPLAQDVRGGFNQFVEDLFDKDGRFRLTVTLFDTDFIPLAVNRKLRDVPKLTEANYQPSGFTALLDAVGKTIHEFDRETELAADERVMVVVQTDGQENSSREYSRDAIFRLIKDREATRRWEFLFLGAGPDIWEQAGSLGFARGNTVSTQPTGANTRSTYGGVAAAAAAYASGASGPEASRIVADSASDNIWRGEDEE